MSKVLSIEFFESTPRILDIKENNVVLDQIKTSDDEPSLYHALYSNNRLAIRKILTNILNGNKLRNIYIHGTDKPEKYGDIISHLISRNSVFRTFHDSISEVMQFLSEKDKERYRGIHENESYTAFSSKKRNAYKIPNTRKKLPENLAFNIEDEYWRDPVKVRRGEGLEGDWSGGSTVFSDSIKKPVVKAGYGTRKKAKNTIRRLRSVSRAKGRQLAGIMYYRAKYNKYQTSGMRNAMKVYKNYLEKTSVES
jgi:hypothetical protein